ncbi:uncharacterized protein LOC110861356 [Folsomia candida]|uniref:uncharacterized protein LOC110861356 n=1 Tax=Folsomia candida TaxID=158441 RepID=UPI001604F3A2|nr:uncharacterized protein LOC110861356 [Folsomia candida]
MSGIITSDGQESWNFPPTNRPPSSSPHRRQDEHAASGDTKKATLKDKLYAKWTSWKTVDNSGTWATRMSRAPFPVMHRYLQKAQWVLVIALVTSALVVPEIRKFVLDRTWKGGLVVFCFEFLTWMTLTLLLGFGWKLPVNYVSLAIARVFLSLELQYEWALQKREGWPALKGFWLTTASMSTMNSILDWFRGQKNDAHETKPGDEIDPMHQIVVNVTLAVTFSVAAWLLTRHSKIRIDKLGNVMLLASFFGTSLGSVILVSSLAITRIGVDLHMAMCKFWVTYAVVGSFVFTFFLLQRQLCSGEKYWVRKRYADAEFAWFALEVLMYLLQGYIVLRFVTSVHSDFDAAKTLKLNVTEMVKVFIPTSNIVTQEFYNLVMVGKMVFENYYGSVPNAMRMDNHE